MKIKLKNYRCYVDAEFDLGDSGTVLISGQSGKGKSTLISAIIFAIQGVEASPKCRIEIEHEGLRIVRSRAPNKLIVTTNGIEYENEAGQAIINALFGKKFDTIGVVKQNSVNSFVGKSPAEKLEFLESFAFNGVDLTELKKRLSVRTKTCESELDASIASVSTAEEIFARREIPEEVKCKRTTEKSMNNEIVRLKKARIRRDALTDELTHLRGLITNGRVSNAELSGKREALRDLIVRIEGEEGKLKVAESVYVGDSEFAELEESFKNIIAEREYEVRKSKYTEDLKRLENMKEAEMRDLTEKYKIKEKQNWDKMSKEEATEFLAQFKSSLVEARKLERAREQLACLEYVDIEKLNDELGVMKEKLSDARDAISSFVCPCCKATLRMANEELCTCVSSASSASKISKDRLTAEISKLETRVRSLTETIGSAKGTNETIEKLKKNVRSFDSELEPVSELEKTISTYERYIFTHTKLEEDLKKEKKRIDSGVYSPAVIALEEALVKEKSKLKELSKTKRTGTFNEEELRDTIVKQKSTRASIESLKSSISTLTAKKGSIKLVEFVDVDALEERKRVLEEEACELAENIDTLTESVALIERYKEYRKKIEAVEKEKVLIEALKKEEVVHRAKYNACLKMKEKVAEAESIALTNVINSINAHVQSYLDTFFPTDPMSARLCAFKETKKSEKALINIEIDYKGAEFKTDMLSGGEYSRLMLAYTLALAELFNSPLLMLDECTSSLDQELTNIVIDGIKSAHGTKLVIMVVHQAVCGLFDRFISL
jgi:DNA repair exonuclease SbcCD ATPase subunit